MKIQDYKVVEGCSPQELDKAVKEQLAEGWQPFGNLVVSNLGADNGYGSIMPYIYLYQAMVRE